MTQDVEGACVFILCYSNVFYETLNETEQSLPLQSDKKRCSGFVGERLGAPAAGRWNAIHVS